MNVLVDTSVWSLALRRRRPPAGAVAAGLAELIREGRVRLLGAVRQELLSGVRTSAEFTKVRDHLRAFPDVALDTRDYEEAASCFNRCRSHGIQGANTDFLICAVAVRHELAVFTTDRDFVEYQTVLPIKLYQSDKQG